MSKHIFGTDSGHTLAHYYSLYHCKHVLLLGRVMSGKGGETILRVCNEILRDEFPALAAACEVSLPDEKTRRVGQSTAAASLPIVR